jgi:hypothetical protein
MDVIGNTRDMDVTAIDRSERWGGEGPSGHARNGYGQNGYGQNGHARNGYGQNGYGQNGHGNIEKRRVAMRSLLTRFIVKATRRQSRSRQDRIARSTELQRHLSWCRRYEEPAALLVARLLGPAQAGRPAAIDAFRVSDSVALELAGGEYELRALLLDRELDRAAVERRLAETLGDGVAFAWACFPDDGVTLQTLVETAHEQLRRGAQRPRQRGVAQLSARSRAPRVREEKYADV